MFNLVMGVMLLVHWNACIYYAISERMGLSTDAWVYPGASYWNLHGKVPKSELKGRPACGITFENILHEVNNTVVSANLTKCHNKTLTNYDDSLYQK